MLSKAKVSQKRRQFSIESRRSKRPPLSSRPGSKKKKVRICITNPEGSEKKLFFYNKKSKDSKLTEKKSESLEKWVHPSGDLDIEKLERLIKFKEREIQQKKEQLRIDMDIIAQSREEREKSKEQEKIEKKDEIKIIQIETDRLSSIPKRAARSKRNDSMPCYNFYSARDKNKVNTVRGHKRTISPVVFKPFTYGKRWKSPKGNSRKNSVGNWKRGRSSSKVKRNSIVDLVENKKKSISDINSFINKSLAKYKLNKRKKIDKTIMNANDFMFNTIGGSNEKKKKVDEKSSSTSILGSNSQKTKGKKKIRNKLSKPMKKKKFDVSLPLLKNEPKALSKLKNIHNKCDTERPEFTNFYGSRRFSERMNSMFSNRSWIKKSLDKVRISLKDRDDMKANIENIKGKKSKKKQGQRTGQSKCSKTKSELGKKSYTAQLMFKSLKDRKKFEIKGYNRENPGNKVSLFRMKTDLQKSKIPKVVTPDLNKKIYSMLCSKKKSPTVKARIALDKVKQKKVKAEAQSNKNSKKKNRQKDRYGSLESTEISSSRKIYKEKKRKSMKASSISTKKQDFYMKDLIKALKGSKTVKHRIFYEHFLQNAKSHSIVSKLKRPAKVDLVSKSIYLPPRKSNIKKTLILDLDETLIHSTFEQNQPSDIKIAVYLQKSSKIEISVNIRPYALSFLEEMSKIYEIVIFSSSHQSYANAILNVLDPDNKFITYRVFRDNCVVAEDGSLIKDLRIFANRDLKEVVILDNSLLCYAWQMENGIPIIPFFADKEDKELAKLSAFLKILKDVDDVREVVGRMFGAKQFEVFSRRPDILSRKLLSCYN